MVIIAESSSIKKDHHTTGTSGIVTETRDLMASTLEEGPEPENQVPMNMEEEDPNPTTTIDSDPNPETDHLDITIEIETPVTE